MGADHAERVARRTPGARLVAVSDPDAGRGPSARWRAGARHGVAGDRGRPAGSDRRRRCRRGDHRLAGFAHAEQLLACLEHGKPVLCEKPLTMDAASALRVVEAEHKLGRQLIQVGFMRRFDPEYAALEAVARLRRARADAAAAQRAPQQVGPGVVPQRDDRAGLDGARGRCRRWLFGDEITRITVHAPDADEPGRRRRARPAAGRVRDGERGDGRRGGVRELPGRVRGAVRGGGRARQRDHRSRGPTCSPAAGSTGAARCRTTSGSGSSRRTTSRCSAGSTPPCAVRSTGRGLGRLRGGGRLRGRAGVVEHRQARRRRPGRPAARYWDDPPAAFRKHHQQ